MTPRERRLLEAQENEQIVGDQIVNVMAGGAWHIEVRLATGKKYSITLEVLKQLLGNFVFEDMGGRLCAPRYVDGCETGDELDDLQVRHDDGGST